MSYRENELLFQKESLTLLLKKIEENTYIEINGELFSEKKNFFFSPAYNAEIAKELKGCLAVKISQMLAKIDAELDTEKKKRYK